MIRLVRHLGAGVYPREIIGRGAATQFTRLDDSYLHAFARKIECSGATYDPSANYDRIKFHLLS